MTDAVYQPRLHRIALLTAAATFPLIFMGGLVTSKQAGLAVPDWPNTYGYNMFIFPPSQWIGGIFYEHVHRLLGTVVGFLAIMLVLFAWAPARTPHWRRRLGIGAIVAALLAMISGGMLWGFRSPDGLTEGFGRHFQHVAVLWVSLAMILTVAWLARQPEPRRWVRWLAVAVLIAVCVQGVFGGLRVTRINLNLAVIHGCFAQAFFCLAALMSVATSRWWHQAPDLSRAKQRDTGLRLIVLMLACLFAIYAQLIAGALMRHHGAGLAIPDLPLAYGKLLPPTNVDELIAANDVRRWELHMEAATMEQMWLHFSHRIGAVLVSVVIIAAAIKVLRNLRQHVELVVPAVLLLILLGAQLTLGVLTVLMRKPADIATLHVAAGALVLLTAFVLGARACRLYAPLCRSSAQSRSAATGADPVVHQPELGNVSLAP